MAIMDGMEGFDPNLQHEIQQKRTYLEKLKEEVSQMKEERNNTKLMSMQQQMPDQDQMDDGMRAGTDEP